jgi:plastocyanin
MTLRRLVAALAAAAVLLGAGACSDGGSPSTTSDTSDAGPIAAEPTVALGSKTFDPRTITIRVGTTVTWRWPDGTVGHDVTGDGFKSPIRTQGTFEHRFDAPGTYTYVCTLHPGMVGRVVAVA